MAYTNKDIIDAYGQAIGAGKSEADFVAYAGSKGITNDQLLSARKELMGGGSDTTSFGRFPDSQYNLFKDWSSGKTLDQITQKASEFGATPEELGHAFGRFGGTGAQVKDVTGYGTGATGFNPDGTLAYNTSFAGGALADGSRQSEWTFDKSTGWNRSGSRGGGSGTGMPSTGIGLSQLQKPSTGIGLSQLQKPSTGIGLSQLQGRSSWDVAPNQTVFDQLQRIIADDSPLMQQARARALQQANSRGLLNSSMAITAGDAAAYDAAMPIAQQDASTYADSARFNADAQNVFSRDNNQFVRDAYMADFNLAANEWAKVQDQARLYDRMSVEQKYALERDAAQNGFQSARDAILNGYQIARDDAANKFTLSRDAAQNKFTLSRDAAQNEFTLSRDAAQNEFTAKQAELDRINRIQLQNIISANSGNQQADTSLQRLGLQIDADNRKFEQQIKTDALKNLNQARVDYWSQVLNLSGKYEGEALTRQMDNLYASYTPVMQSFATQAGLDPTTATAGMRPASTTATAPSPQPSGAPSASAPQGDWG